MIFFCLFNTDLVVLSLYLPKPKRRKKWKYIQEQYLNYFENVDKGMGGSGNVDSI